MNGGTIDELAKQMLSKKLGAVIAFALILWKMNADAWMIFGLGAGYLVAMFLYEALMGWLKYRAPSGPEVVRG